METWIFIQVRVLYLTVNSPTSVGRDRCCSYSYESHKYNLWDNLSTCRQLSGIENQLIVEDRVVFLLEYEFVEIRDSARFLLLASVSSGWGMSRLIFDINIWRRVLACVDLYVLWLVPSPLLLGARVYLYP